VPARSSFFDCKDIWQIALDVRALALGTVVAGHASVDQAKSVALVVFGRQALPADLLFVSDWQAV
jgi:hypothetical protein